jgi:hypothetical protein
VALQDGKSVIDVTKEAPDDFMSESEKRSIIEFLEKAGAK